MVTVGSLRRRERLDRAFNGVLALIGVQFLIGMWLNLFGTFPTDGGNLGTALAYTADPLLAVHVVLGILLVLGGLALLIQSFFDPVRMIRWFAIGGFAALIFAALAGSNFVYSGYASDVSSFLMAVGFAGAVTAYYEGLVRLRAHPLSPIEAAPFSSPG